MQAGSDRFALGVCMPSVQDVAAHESNRKACLIMSLKLRVTAAPTGILAVALVSDATSSSSAGSRYIPAAEPSLYQIVRPRRGCVAVASLMEPFLRLNPHRNLSAQNVPFASAVQTASQT